MDGGLSRVPQPIDDRRPAPRRGAPVRRPADEPQAREAEPRSEQRPSASRSNTGQSDGKKRFLLPIIIGLLIIVLAVAGWLVWFGAAVSNNTAAGSYSTDMSMIAVGKF